MNTGVHGIGQKTVTGNLQVGGQEPSGVKKKGGLFTAFKNIFRAKPKGRKNVFNELKTRMENQRDNLQGIARGQVKQAQVVKQDVIPSLKKAVDYYEKKENELTEKAKTCLRKGDRATAKRYLSMARTCRKRGNGYKSQIKAWNQTAQKARLGALGALKLKNQLSEKLGRLEQDHARFQQMSPAQQEKFLEKLENRKYQNIDKAREMLAPDGLSNKEIRTLTTHQKALLADTLSANANKGTDAEKTATVNALKRLYANLKPGDIHPPSELKMRKDLHDRLSNDPTIKLAKENWGTMSTEQKKTALQVIADHQARAFGLGNGDLVFSPLRPGLHGETNIATGVVTINENMLNSGFEDLANTVIHENTHRYQLDLKDKMDNGQLPENDDRRDLAMFVKSNIQKYFGGAGPAYKNQPVERHAWDEGDIGEEHIRNSIA